MVVSIIIAYLAMRSVNTASLYTKQNRPYRRFCPIHCKLSVQHTKLAALLGLLSQHFIHRRGSTLAGGQAEIHITQCQDGQEDDEHHGIEPSHGQ